jgi:L-amino acid N-acyltransferase YncA
MSSSYYIRDATEADLHTIVEIYNEQILNSSSLFVYSPVGLDNRLDWFRTCKSKGFPIIVAVKKASDQEGQEGEIKQEEVAAYCSLGTFRDKPAYNAYVNTRLLRDIDFHLFFNSLHLVLPRSRSMFISTTDDKG